MQVFPRITGVFSIRRLELAAWAVLTSLVFLVVIFKHSAEASGAPSTAPSWRMNINAAPYDEIMTLPGMTSRRAHAIISAREKRGKFESPSDILSVPGINSGYFHRIENMLEAKN